MNNWGKGRRRTGRSITEFFGRALVSALADNSNTAGLYTTSQIQALNIGTPLLTRPRQLTAQIRVARQPRHRTHTAAGIGNSPRAAQDAARLRATRHGHRVHRCGEQSGYCLEPPLPLQFSIRRNTPIVPSIPVLFRFRSARSKMGRREVSPRCGPRGMAAFGCAVAWAGTWGADRAGQGFG